MATKVVQMTKEELSNLNDRLDRDVAFIGTALDRFLSPKCRFVNYSS
jgi:hypothetical protein